MNLKELYSTSTESFVNGDIEVPHSSTLSSCTSGAYVNGTSITGCGPITSGGSITTGTVTTPPYIYPNAWTWPGVPPTPANDAFNIRTKLDDNGKDTLILTLGAEKNCNYKVQLLPGVFLYSSHSRPGLFQRFILRLLFGIKWESTLAERFINAL